MTVAIRTRNIVLVSLAVALTTAGAWLRIPLGPVPISLQTLFVLLSGAVLGPMLGATAMVVYLAIGLIGLPVFTAGGGPGYLVSPTFGFLLSFPLAAMTVGFLCRLESRGVKTTLRFRGLLAFAAGTAVIYLVGVPWLGLNLKYVQGKELGPGALLMLGVVPFLPGDFLKIMLASLLFGPIQRTINRRKG
jgi:biotin transport system substrate-specific component